VDRSIAFAADIAKANAERLARPVANGALAPTARHVTAAE
jgi:hypothetical protein